MYVADMAGGVFLHATHRTGYWPGHWSSVQSVSRHVSHCPPILSGPR